MRALQLSGTVLKHVPTRPARHGAASPLIVLAMEEGRRAHQLGRALLDDVRAAGEQEPQVCAGAAPRHALSRQRSDEGLQQWMLSPSPKALRRNQSKLGRRRTESWHSNRPDDNEAVRGRLDILMLALIAKQAVIAH
eukprot:6177818-Pleurochrysis_carterae.AAC.4